MDRLTFEGDFCDIIKCDLNDNSLHLCMQGDCLEKNVWERLREYEDAEEAGRLVRLPCKVGDTAWVITSPINIAGMETHDEQPMIFACEIGSISLYANAEMQIRLYHQGVFVASYITADDFGKTVFLTREEAEAALEREETT